MTSKAKKATRSVACGQTQEAPESRSVRGRVWLAVLLAFSLIMPIFLLNSLYSYASTMGDECVLLNGAKRVYGGEVPYRDFFSIITPMTYYAGALFFKVLGVGLVQARLLVFAIHIGLTLGFVAACAALGIPPRLRAAGLVMLIGFGTPSWFMLNHHWLANLWVLLSLWMLLLSRGQARPWHLVAGGALAGMAAMTLQDLGSYWILGASLWIAVVCREESWRGLARFWGGLAAAVLPVCLYLVVKVPFSELVGQLILEPIAGYHSDVVNREHFGQGLFRYWDFFREILGQSSGGMKWAHALLALFNLIGEVAVCLAFLSAGAVAVWRIYRTRAEGGDAGKVTALLAAWLASAFTLARHPAGQAFNWAFMPSLLILLLAVSAAPSRPWRRARAILFGLLLVVFGTVGLGRVLWVPLSTPHEKIALPGGTVWAYNGEERDALKLALAARGSLIRPGERVYCYRANTAFYFLLDFTEPSRYDYIGSMDMAPRRIAEMLASFEKKPPVWVLWDRKGEDQDPVYVYLQDHYEVVRLTARLALLRRTPEKTP